MHTGQRTTFGVSSLLQPWVLGIELKLLGFCNNYVYLLSQFTDPICICIMYACNLSMSVEDRLNVSAQACVSTLLT